MNLNLRTKTRERLIQIVESKEYFHHLVVKAAIIELHRRDINAKTETEWISL